MARAELLRGTRQSLDALGAGQASAPKYGLTGAPGFDTLPFALHGTIIKMPFKPLLPGSPVWCGFCFQHDKLRRFGVGFWAPLK